MRRPSKSQAVDPDRHYQLASPVLVMDPPTLIERTLFDLARFKFLWEQLGNQARILRINVAELDARGGCPPELRESIDKALALCAQGGLEEQERRGVGGLRDGDGVGIHIHNHPDDVVLNTIAGGMSEGGEVEEERLAKILGGINFASPIRIVRRYGPRVVSEALRQLYARPSGEVVNPGAYLRAILKRYAPAQDASPVELRFCNGKYGHVVQT